MEEEFFDEDEFLTREHASEGDIDTHGISERDASYLGDETTDDD